MLKQVICGILAVLVVGVLVDTATATTAISGDLFYTRFDNQLKENIVQEIADQSSGFGALTSITINGQVFPANSDLPDVVNVKKATFSWDGTDLQLGTPTDIAQTQGADGIIFAPGGTHLIIGGQNNNVHRLPADGSAIGNPGLIQTLTLDSTATSFHLALEPGGTTVLTSDQPGDTVSRFPADFSGPATLHDAQRVTQYAFAPDGQAFYVQSEPDGLQGRFGITDLTADPFDNIRKIRDLDGAHSISYDPFTGDMILFGDSMIHQIDITDIANVPDDTHTVKSTLDLS